MGIEFCDNVKMANALKTAGKVAYNIIKWVPPINILTYGGNEMYDDRKKGKSEMSIFLKSFAHLGYAMIGSGALFLWGAGAYLTGEINPNKAAQVLQHKREQVELEKRDYQVQLNNFNDRVFGVNGLADINKDGKVDFNERAEAYRRMGLEEQVLFPNANKDDLEKAVRSY